MRTKWGILLVVGGGATALLWWRSQLQPAAPGNSTPVTFVIARHQSAATTSQKLFTQGLIKSPVAARLYLRLTGLDRKVQAGAYSLSPDMDLETLLLALTRGPQDVWVTLPEGFRREQIAARIAAATAAQKAFDTAEFIDQTATLEGQLFPDTYLLPTSATAGDVVKILTDNFARKTKLDIRGQRDALIIASLVEREARSDPDRSVIAGIMLKRLKAGWPLDVDATVQYAVDSAKCKGQIAKCNWWEPVADTKFTSAYNTYLHAGLPPGPIANPGLAVIQAALAPQDSAYWFYLTSPDGTTHYARTLSEHQAHIDKYLTP